MDIVKLAPFVFTVAGTNGKGTTCRTLETVLMAAGYKVGLQLPAPGALHRTRAHSGG